MVNGVIFGPAVCRSDKIRVIVVDDHDIVRHGILAVLREQTDIEIAGEGVNGREAVELARKLQPDVAIVDLHMPEMSGLAACGKITREVSCTRVVIFSASDDAGSIRAAVAAGASGYVVKQGEVSILIDAIRTVDRGHRFLDPTLSDVVAEELRTFQPISLDTKLLSRRLTEVLALIALGYTSKEIAQQMQLSPKTVECYRARICDRLGTTSRAEMTQVAFGLGLVDPSSPTTTEAVRDHSRAEFAHRCSDGTATKKIA